MKIAGLFITFIGALLAWGAITDLNLALGLLASFILFSGLDCLWMEFRRSGWLCRLIDHKWARKGFPIASFTRAGEWGEQDRCVRCGVRGRCYTGDKISEGWLRWQHAKNQAWRNYLAETAAA